MKNGLIIESDNSKRYYLNDLYHREDGPAVECVNGDKYWYKHNKCHREDGPAFEGKDRKSWFINGQRHRIGGPAIEFVDGSKRWFWHGEEINCSSQEEFEQLIRLKAFW